MAVNSYRAVSLLPFFMLGASLAASDCCRTLGIAVIAGCVGGLLGALRLVGVLGRRLSGDLMDRCGTSLSSPLPAVVAAVLAVSGGVAVLRRPVADQGGCLSVYALQLVCSGPSWTSTAGGRRPDGAGGVSSCSSWCPAWR